MGRTSKRDKVDVLEKRLEIIVGAKLRDKSRLEDAISTQDRLRKKSRGWNGATEIRRWRDSR